MTERGRARRGLGLQRPSAYLLRGRERLGREEQGLVSVALELEPEVDYCAGHTEAPSAEQERRQRRLARQAPVEHGDRDEGTMEAQQEHHRDQRAANRAKDQAGVSEEHSARRYKETTKKPARSKERACAHRPRDAHLICLPILAWPLRTRTVSPGRIGDDSVARDGMPSSNAVCRVDPEGGAGELKKGAAEDCMAAILSTIRWAGFLPVRTFRTG